MRDKYWVISVRSIESSRHSACVYVSQSDEEAWSKKVCRSVDQCVLAGGGSPCQNTIVQCIVSTVAPPKFFSLFFVQPTGVCTKHKCLSNPPGRPIISGNESLTEKASRCVDCVLMPHVTCLSSYIRDTSDLLRHVEGTHAPLNALLMAVDIEALYSSILHERGIQVIGSLPMEQDRTTLPYNHFVLNLLRFILTRNHFTFMDQMYLQRQEVAMGTCCAPSYANL